MILIVLSVISCKKRSHNNPIHPSQETKATLTPTKLDLIDGSSLQKPTAQISVGNVCGSDTFKIQMKTFDPNAQYFQFRFCDPKNPNQCQPSINAGFSDVNIELPNLLYSTNIDIPLVQLRSCVRGYDAVDASKNCSLSWESISPVPSVKTDAYISDLLWQKFLNSEDLIQQCFNIRKSLLDFQNKTKGQKIDPNIEKIISDSISIGVDNCARNIDSGLLDSIDELLLTSSTETELNTNTAVGLNLTDSTDTHKSPNLAAGLGAGLGVGLGLLILGSVVAYKYYSDYKKIDTKFKSIKKYYDDQLEKLRRHTESKDPINTLREEWKKVYGSDIERMTRYTDDKRNSVMEKNMKDYTTGLGEFVEKRFKTYTKDGVVTIEDAEARNLGWDKADLMSKGATISSEGKIVIKLKTLQEIPPKTLLEKTQKLQAIFKPENKPTLDMELERYRSAEIEFETWGKKDAIMQNELKEKTNPLLKEKSSAKFKGLAGVGVMVVGIIAGVVAGMGASGSFGLDSTPLQDLSNALTNIRSQIKDLLQNRDLILTQIDLCTVTSL
jgi:hypothetical protein